MQRVTPSPWLPMAFAEAREPLLNLLRAVVTSVNQAAEGRLREHVSVTSAYTAGENDHVIQVAPSAPFTVTLPLASKMRGKTVTVKRTNNTTHTVTVQPVSGNIDGSASVTLTTAYQRRHFFSDGTQWWEHT